MGMRVGQRHKRFLGLRSAGAAVTGGTTGTGTTGAGYGLGDAADTGGKSGEGGHLTPGGLMAFGAFGVICGLTQRTHPLEFRIAFGADIFVNRHSNTPNIKCNVFLRRGQGGRCCQQGGQGVGYAINRDMRWNMIHKIDIKTKSQVDFQEITVMVKGVVEASGIKNGVCHIFVPHTTAGVLINEYADPSVVEDINAQLEEIVPYRKNYRHLEGNSPAHIKASLMGDSRTLFIEEGRLVLGTWQGIFFCEFDGPRNRSVLVKIIGDKV